MTSNEPRSATAFAPATVGNVAVGFDILGCALEAPGDRVTVERIDAPEVRVDSIEGLVTDLPMAAGENTATAGLVELVDDLGLDYGLSVSIDKGIPLGSGMGGSAASAVASVVAADAVVDAELEREELLRYALVGETVASGAMHGDNVTPCLCGGLTLTRSVDPIDVVELPVPERIRCILVYPHRRIDTERARRVVPEEMAVARYVEQSANLAGFVAACYRDDLELLERSLADVLVEPYRKNLIPGFSTVRRAAIAAGALGCSISGAGPSLFAWTTDDREDLVAEAMRSAFVEEGADVDVWSGPISARGAYVVDSSG